MSLGPTVIAVSWTEFGVVSGLFAGRVYVNAAILRRFRADFWWATSTYVCLTLSVSYAIIPDANISLGHCHHCPSFPRPLSTLGPRRHTPFSDRAPDHKEPTLSVGIHHLRYYLDRAG